MFCAILSNWVRNSSSSVFAFSSADFVSGQVELRNVTASGPSQTSGWDNFWPWVSNCWIWSVSPPWMIDWIWRIADLASSVDSTRALMTSSPIPTRISAAGHDSIPQIDGRKSDRSGNVSQDLSRTASGSGGPECSNAEGQPEPLRSAGNPNSQYRWVECRHPVTGVCPRWFWETFLTPRSDTIRWSVFECSE